jgi:acyl-CoA thioesterase
MEAQRLAERSAQKLLANDRASRGLGMEILEIKPGYACVSMTIRAQMVNGHGRCHGGFIFMLADSTFAFCCCSYNEVTVAAAASIDFLAAAYEGDVLRATAQRVWRSDRSGLYDIVVSNQRSEPIALFRGRARRLPGQVVTETGVD